MRWWLRSLHSISQREIFFLSTLLISIDNSSKEGLSGHGQMGYFGSLFYKAKNVRESSSWEKYTMEVDDLP